MVGWIEKKACFGDPAYAGSPLFFTSEKVRISGAPLIQEHLQNKPFKAPDCPVPMPDRHGFPKYRHGFCERGVVFTSETEIRE
jgi:hypothetical protein